MLTVWLSIIIAILGLSLAGFVFSQIVKQKVTDQNAVAVSNRIASGAMTFLAKEYFVLSLFVLVLALIMLALPIISRQLVFTFIAGAIFSALVGFVALKISTIFNVRVAENFRQNTTSGLTTAFSGSSIIGLVVTGLGILGVALLYTIFRDPQIIYGFAFGASLAALFLRVGGGIYTKVADVSADLVSKLENNIDEDNINNPASLVDNIGDNVGDVAGASVDLFESYVSSIITAMFLGVLLLPLFGSGAVALPLLLSVAGLVSTAVGLLLLKYLKGEIQSKFSRVILISLLVDFILSALVIKIMVSDWGIFASVIVGLFSGLIVALAIKYFVSEKNRPVRELAKSCQTGAVTNIISGLSLGFYSVLFPVFTMAVTIYLASSFAGLYGLAMAIVAMLSVVGTVLAVNMCGPIVDNASGIAQMANLGSEVRQRAEQIDALGNTTAAVGRGFAICSAVLTSLVLLIIFSQIINLEIINLIDLSVLAGLLIGGLVPFVFVALVIRSIDFGIIKKVKEIKKQFQMQYRSKGGEMAYEKCVEIATLAALRQIIIPGILAILPVLIIGFLFGPESLIGFLLGLILVGFLLALFLSNTGSAWDNAKKFIEADNFGGKGSEAHKAAITGDLIGDPLKDVAGPALNILIKLSAIVAVIMAGLFV